MLMRRRRRYTLASVLLLLLLDLLQSTLVRLAVEVLSGLMLGVEGDVTRRTAHRTTSQFPRRYNDLMAHRRSSSSSRPNLLQRQ